MKSSRYKANRWLLLIPITALLLGSSCGQGIASTGPPQSHSSRVDSLLKHMTLRQKIGQMLMVSFVGTTIDSNTQAMLKTFQPGGITLFGDNFSDTGQLQALDASLQGSSHIPLFISVDQEGGEVNRITSGVKQLPSESQYGQLNDPKLVRSDTSTEAKQIHKLGVNMNLAPVLDVASDPNSIIAQEERSFGPHPKRDAALGLAAIRGYQGHGVAATAKHVLGLGTTSTNPETQLPTINLTSAQLKAQLLPFKMAANAGVDSMMVTHVLISGITSGTTPASLSYKVVTGILRQQLGYHGVLMTDSLIMGAIRAHFKIGQACAMAVNAGEDILLIAGGGPLGSNTLSNAVHALTNKVKSGKVKMSSINASVKRILKLKRKLHLAVPSA